MTGDGFQPVEYLGLRGGGGRRRIRHLPCGRTGGAAPGFFRVATRRSADDATSCPLRPPTALRRRVAGGRPATPAPCSKGDDDLPAIPAFRAHGAAAARARSARLGVDAAAHVPRDDGCVANVVPAAAGVGRRTGRRPRRGDSRGRRRHAAGRHHAAGKDVPGVAPPVKQAGQWRQAEPQSGVRPRPPASISPHASSRHIQRTRAPDAPLDLRASAGNCRMRISRVRFRLPSSTLQATTTEPPQPRPICTIHH